MSPDITGLVRVVPPLPQVGGGSAFPHDAQANGLGGSPTAPGVSRLEWYAAQFIAPLIRATLSEYDRDPAAGLPDCEALACHAFDYAEAMVAEANRRHLNPKDT